MWKNKSTNLQWEQMAKNPYKTKWIISWWRRPGRWWRPLARNISCYTAYKVSNISNFSHHFVPQQQKNYINERQQPEVGWATILTSVTSVNSIGFYESTVTWWNDFTPSPKLYFKIKFLHFAISESMSWLRGRYVKSIIIIIYLFISILLIYHWKVQ